MYSGVSRFEIHGCIPKDVAAFMPKECSDDSGDNVEESLDTGTVQEEINNCNGGIARFDLKAVRQQLQK
jgi:hypothetical protein